jgi:hypothetical protein
MLRLLTAIFLWSCIAAAQQIPLFERQINPFTVLDENGDAYTHTFFGGLNTPSHQFVDIDGDGDADLFIRDRSDSLIFFRNQGTSQMPDFQWVTDAYQQLFIGSWFKFADVDNDADFDLFAETPFGIIRYYQNIGTPSAPQFVIAADSLRDIAGELILVDGPSVPEWADMYCNGQLDLYLGRISGYITEYRLQGFDTHNIPLYEHVTDTFQNLQILTGGAKNASQPRTMRHGANSLTFIDIDADSDLDLFWGDFFAGSIIFIENTGSCGSPSLDTTNIVEQYPPSDPVNTGGFNIPRFADLDGDNDFEMFVSVFGGANSFVADKEENFYYYLNTGSSTNPVFELQTKKFINSIDIGQNTVPALADIDADGDLDLFLANQIDLNAPGQSNSRIYFFENTDFGNTFVLRNKNYLNFDKPLFGSNYAPAFGDLDSDGDPDLLIGQWDGKIIFWRNNGTPSNAQFELVSENYLNIDVGSNSTPELVDIDGDLDLDLFIGEAAGNINFYENRGTPQQADFVFVTDNFAGIQLGFQQYSHPAFINIDGDDDDDLFVGSDTKGVLCWINIGDRQNPQFVREPSYDITGHLRSAPVFGLLDSDLNPDLLIGVDGGGAVYYKNNVLTPGIGQSVPSGTFHLFKAYPNPFNPFTTIEYQLTTTVSEDHFVTIYDVLGKPVRQWRFLNQPLSVNKTLTWNGTDDHGNPLSTGLYLIEIRTASNLRLVEKIIFMK